MLSGNGPAIQLRDADIDVIVDAPVTYDMGIVREALVALEYFFTKSGIGSTNAAEQALSFVPVVPLARPTFNCISYLHCSTITDGTSFPVTA